MYSSRFTLHVCISIGACPNSRPILLCYCMYVQVLASACICISAALPITVAVCVIYRESWSLARVRVRSRDRAGHSASRLSYERDSGQRASNWYGPDKIGTVGQFVMYWFLMSQKQRKSSNQMTITMHLLCLKHTTVVQC